MNEKEKLMQKALELHASWKGKIEVNATVPVNDKQDLSMAYTPGVAQPCLEIAKDKELSYKYTRRWNMVAVVSDGSAVLGLGDIGPEAAMPVMEGKCVLFKTFADVDAFPICLNTKDVDEIVDIIAAMEPSFGGINLEDIAAPRCFEVEEKLKQRVNIPVFHDDQHGTAIVLLAALINSFKLTNRKFSESTVVINGAGSAGIACAKLLLSYGVGDIIMCDKVGVLYKGIEGVNQAMVDMAGRTNKHMVKGSLADAIKGADAFVGVSAPGVLTKDMVSTMNDDAIVLPMANPTPEIFPEEAFAGGARIVGTGRSDYKNQINNVLAFPGIFRGVLDARIKEITTEIKLATAEAIANIAQQDGLSDDYIIPKPFDDRVGKAVAKAVIDTVK